MSGTNNNNANISAELVEKYLHKFRDDEKYYIGDEAIIELCNKFPDNRKIEHVLLKVSAINDLYGTNVYGTFKFAQHLQQLNIDKELYIGKPELVHTIAKCSINGRVRNYYSFATKYCSWHNPESYPVYDKFVHLALRYFDSCDHFARFSDSDLKKYPAFKKVIGIFVKHYKLDQFSSKQIGKFLWMYGRELAETTKNS